MSLATFLLLVLLFAVAPRFMFALTVMVICAVLMVGAFAALLLILI